MKRILSVVAFSALLNGCAYQNLVTMDVRPAATCFSDLQCKAMWLAAKQSLQSLTGYRIQTMSDDYIETYANSNSPYLIAGSATKQPNPDGSYTINPRFQCLSILGCGGREYQAMDQFNASVAAAGERFGTTKKTPQTNEKLEFKAYENSFNTQDRK